MSRSDLDVYNEATGFMITSKGLCGRDFSGVDAGDESWGAAIEAGIFLPFELVQDDGFIIRILLGEPLSEQEEAEWVGVSRHKLRIPDGNLTVIGGGPEYLWGEDMEEFTRFLEVPPGDYLAEVYTYLQGVNGPSCLGGVRPREALGSYFRRTRPGEPFPPWLRNECASDPSADPAHEAEWEGVEADYDTEQPHYIGFMIRLSPYAEVSDRPEMEGGWFSIGKNARRPAVCPFGVVADHLVARDDD